MTSEERILNAIDGYVYGLPDSVNRYMYTFDISLKADSGKLAILRLINQFYEVVSEQQGIPRDKVTKEHIASNIEVFLAAYLHKSIQSSRKSIGLREPTEKEIEKRRVVLEEYLKYIGIPWPEKFEK